MKIFDYNMIYKVRKMALLLIAVQFSFSANAQYKTYKLSVNGDTLNAIDKNGLKEGKWVIHTDPLRGEPGYEEEGIFIKNKKEGFWRRYTLQGDLTAIESYRYGGKDGLSQYFTPLGELAREENWKAYNPDSPYDTIPIYGTGSNEILSYKIVKAEQYSVKNGNWTYYDPSTGRIMKLEKYDHNRLLQEPKTDAVAEEPKKVAKPAEVLEYEKKNSGKKKVKVRDGQTGN
jgi:antitoxin component YwqK of YwqJK toxin-antitoxin module